MFAFIILVTLANAAFSDNVVPPIKPVGPTTVPHQPALNAGSHSQNTQLPPNTPLNNAIEILYADEKACDDTMILMNMVFMLLRLVSQDPNYAGHVTNIINTIKQQPSNKSPEYAALFDQIVKLGNNPNLQTTNDKGLGNILRSYAPNQNLHTKIIFKFVVPSIDDPQCKQAFLDLLQTAYKNYADASKYPMCGGNNANFPPSNINPYQNFIYNGDKGTNFFGYKYQNDLPNSHVNPPINPITISPILPNQNNYQLPTNNPNFDNERALNVLDLPNSVSPNNKNLMEYFLALALHKPLPNQGPNPGPNVNYLYYYKQPQNLNYYQPPTPNQGFVIPNENTLPQHVLNLILQFPQLKEYILKIYGLNQLPDQSSQNLLNINQYKLPFEVTTAMPNWNKLDVDSTPGIIELTYILKQPQVVYQPLHYVKYRLPYTKYLENVNILLSSQPQLKLNPAKLYQELAKVSSISETSPDLRGYRKEDLIHLTQNGGQLVKAQILNDNDLSQQFRAIQSLNTNVAAEDILNLNRNLTAIALPSKSLPDFTNFLSPAANLLNNFQPAANPLNSFQTVPHLVPNVPINTNSYLQNLVGNPNPGTGSNLVPKLRQDLS